MEVGLLIIYRPNKKDEETLHVVMSKEGSVVNKF